MQRRRLLSFACAGLAVGAAPAGASPRLRVRPLDDVATIGVPAGLEPERYAATADESMHRLAFQFASRYLWASMGGVIRYRQVMVVSVLAPDAPPEAIEAWLQRWPVSYESRGRVRVQPLAGGTLRITEAVYAVGVDREPAFEYRFVDRTRSLQILWHAVASQHDPATAPATIERMASGYRLLRDPTPLLADARARPAREAATREQRRASVQELLAREGYGLPEPGVAQWRRGAWLEWMDEPERRYQLLVPLGFVRIAPGSGVHQRPRPLGSSSDTRGVGWREFIDGDWLFTNRDHGYLPFRGIAATLAARQHDPACVYFYWAGTVRVDHETDPRRLGGLAWFFDALPSVQRRWHDGALVGPGRPEAEGLVR